VAALHLDDHSPTPPARPMEGVGGLARLSAHGADTVLRVEALASGHAADVHGQLAITQRGPAGDDERRTRLQFRTREQGVTFFPPGLATGHV